MKKVDLKKVQGITLIALVITIIVLLILAAVSIATLTGENGILTRANDAKEQTKISELKERLELIGIEVYQSKTPILEGEEYMKEYETAIKKDAAFKNAQKVERIGLEIEVISEEGYIFQITENEVKYIGKTDEKQEEVEISINCSEIIDKTSTLTVNIDNNNGNMNNYKIYVNDVEVESIDTNEKSFIYNIQTSFGNQKIYVKMTDEGLNEIKSNEIYLEDNTIKTLDELKKFRDIVNSGNDYEGKTIYQVANIDMVSNNWIPIGNDTNSFKGTYDGQGFDLSNIYIETDASNQGLFGVNKGTIKNIGIKSGTISAGNNTGGIAGINERYHRNVL